MKKKEPPHGGARKGSGRKRQTDEPRDCYLTIAFTDKEMTDLRAKHKGFGVLANKCRELILKELL